MLTEAGKAEGEDFVYTEAPIGGAAIDATGDPYPASTEEVCKASDAVLLACIGGCARGVLCFSGRPTHGCCFAGACARERARSAAGLPRRARAGAGCCSVGGGVLGAWRRACRGCLLRARLDRSLSFAAGRLPGWRVDTMPPRSLLPLRSYKWDSLPNAQRPEKGLLRLRSSLNAFANLRPAVVLPQLADASTLKREVRPAPARRRWSRRRRRWPACRRRGCRSGAGRRVGLWRPPRVLPAADRQHAPSRRWRRARPSESSPL